MRFSIRSLVRRGSWSSVVAFTGLVSGAHAADISLNAANGGVVGTLSVMNDLEPLSQVDAMERDGMSTSLARPAAPVKPMADDTQIRASVPASDRSLDLIGIDDVFVNSKAAFPLLVSDMDSFVSPVSRPMSAALVGERPSLPLLNRVPLTRTPAKSRR